MTAGRLVLVATIAASSLALASPSREVQFLIDDEVSVLDFGLYRVETELNRRAGAGYRVSARYDWNANRVIIRAEKIPTGLFGGGEPSNYFNSVDEARTAIKNMINGLRIELGIDTNTGKPFTDSSFLGVHFGHSGYQIAGEPEGLWPALDQCTELQAEVFCKINGEFCIIEGRGALVGKDVFVGEAVCPDAQQK